jgi:PAS domain S-box-containing protein
MVCWRCVSLRDRELYRLFDRSPVGMYRSDEAGRLYYVNAALARLLGYDSIEDVLKLNLSRDIYVNAADRARLLAQTRTEIGVDGVRVRWRTKSGRELIVQVYGHLVDEDTPDGSIYDASVLDVTELETTNALLRSEREVLATTAATLDLVVRQMTGMYWIVDRDLRICRSGGAIPEMLGYAPGRYLGMTIDQVHRIDPSSIDPTAMHRRALTGETITFASEYRDKHLVTTVAPHRSNDRIVGVIGTCIDVTTHYLLERRMVDAQRAESLGVLAGGLAHDFNNLLVAILGNADLAMRELGPRAPGRAPLDNIRQASMRAAELTEQLLAYAGRGGVASTQVQPNQVVDELLRISAPTMPGNVVVRVDIPRDLVMRGDASQIRQVLLNLVNNARDALGPRGGAISIAGRLRHYDGTPSPDDVMTAQPGSYVELEVADDGPGMTDELRRRIFEPFFTTKPTGHGLGLASVVGIVRAHAGGLRLATAPGRGARFQILWPSTETPTELASMAPPNHGHTVLIIDDEDLVRDVVARMIEDLGYGAITATNGVAGLAIVDHLSIDAVLIDLTTPKLAGATVMSQMTGAAVVTALRERRPDLPIILCSGQGREGRALRADAYLAKPFRIDTLDHTLARLLPR